MSKGRKGRKGRRLRVKSFLKVYTLPWRLRALARGNSDSECAQLPDHLRRPRKLRTIVVRRTRRFLDKLTSELRVLRDLRGEISVSAWVAVLPREAPTRR